MIPGRFAYATPRSAAEAVALLAGADARVLAGGTWVVPELGTGVSRPALVVDLRRAGLGTITAGDGTVRVGATATYADVLASELVRERLPLLREMAGGITGGWAIRGQGTIGGSLAAARPQSDVPAVLVALGAIAHVAGADGERSVPGRVAACRADAHRPGPGGAAHRPGDPGAGRPARLLQAQARREQLADRDRRGHRGRRHGDATRARRRGGDPAGPRSGRRRAGGRTRGTTSSPPAHIAPRWPRRSRGGP